MFCIVKGGFIMYLYEHNGKHIDVYAFISDEKSLIEYREENIKKQNIDELFYCFTTTNERLKQCFVNADDFDIRYLELDFDNWWVDIKGQRATSETKELIQKEILERYINGKFSQVIPTRTFIPTDGNDCYFDNYLVTEQPTNTYSSIEKKKVYKIDDLLSLPDNLCALQLLLNGEFARILRTNLDYSEPLQFFKVIKEAEISLDNLKQIINYKLMNETYNDEVEYKIDTASTILQKVRKIK